MGQVWLPCGAQGRHHRSGSSITSPLPSGGAKPKAGMVGPKTVRTFVPTATAACVGALSFATRSEERAIADMEDRNGTLPARSRILPGGDLALISEEMFI